ncbi:NACHT domain-containing protein [Micromonospora echinospora]|uniref:NACHT domain-containing protein n=1 Tax=Micromonospora echinospora TaxID=1877 RepID=UPI0037B1E81C
MRRFRLRLSLWLIVAAGVAAGVAWSPLVSARRIDPALAVVGALALVATLAAGLSLRLRQPPEKSPDERLVDAHRELATAVRRTIDGALAASVDSSLPLRLRRSPERPGPLGSARLGDLGMVFRSLGHRQLVIVGAPGSGKTTSALLLARGLLHRAATPDAPVPVVLPARRWRPAVELLEAFVARSLRESHPSVGDKPTIERLVLHGRVLPILDGLDEMDDDSRDEAVQALGRYDNGIVVTCRTDTFERLLERPGPFPGRAAIAEIEPLDADTIVAWLSRGTPEGQRQAVVEEIRRHPAGILARALDTPLMVSLARPAFASPDLDLPTLLALPDHEAARSAILAAALDQGLPDDDELAPRWLATLARLTARAGSQEYRWWRLARHTWPVAGWPRLGMLLALATAGALAEQWWWTVLVADVALLSAGFLLRLHHRYPRPRRIATGRWGRVVLGGVVGAGVALGVAGWAFLADLLPPTSHRPSGTLLAYGLVGAAVALLFWSRLGPRPTSQATSLAADRQAAFSYALAAGGLTGGASYLTPGTGTWLALAIAVATFTVVLLDGSAWGQYLLARLRFVFDGQLPWRLGTLLDQAERAGLLVGDGDGYRFRHVMVRDYLIGREAARPGPRLVAAIPEILEEVLVLPEAVAYVGADPDDDRRREVRSLTRAVLENDGNAIEATGAERYARFRQAHDRLVTSAVSPFWVRVGRVCGPLAGLGAALGLAALGLLSPPLLSVATEIVPIALAPLFTALLVDWLVARPARSVVPYRPAVGVAVLWWLATQTYLTVPAVRAVVPVRHVGVLCVVLTPVLIFAWLAARPHLDAHRGFREEDPALWPPPTPATRRHVEAAIQARRDWLTTIARDGLLPLIRNRLRQGRDEYALVLPDLDPARLGAVSRMDQLVDNAAGDQVDWALRHLDTASIGVSGARGAGKSTLLQRFCTEPFRTSDDDVLVLVHAPTAYDRREFLVHLFAETCVRLGAVAPDGAIPARLRRRHRLSALAPAAGLAVGVGLVVGASFGEALSALGRSLWTNPRTTLLVLGGLLVAASTGWAVWRSRPALRAPGRASESALAAAGHLRMLRYQSMVSEKVAGKVGLPGGLEVSSEGSVQRTEHVRTYPELVAQFRTLLDQAALERRPRGNRIVIGIDELDKMSSPAEAERFLNDLKAVFGVSGCYFVVAVSEDALAAFDRRALGVRTTFDSAFDTVVAVTPLSVTEAGRLLELRGVVIPAPFLWLCHTLSGGRPRELLRTVMTLATVSSLHGLERLDVLAAELIRSDLATILPAQVRQAEALGAPATEVVDWLARAAEAPVTAPSLEAQVWAAPSVAPDQPATEVVAQSRTYLYHAATLLRSFSDDAAEIVSWLRARPDLGPVDRLAHARARIAVQPTVAWQAIDAYRRAAPGLAVVHGGTAETDARQW